MRMVGDTSSGTVLVEMSPTEWGDTLQETDGRPRPNEVEERSIEWHVRQATEENKLSVRTRNAILRATEDYGSYHPGMLAGKSFSEFLACLQSGAIVAVRNIGEKSAQELRHAFLGTA